MLTPKLAPQYNKEWGAGAAKLFGGTYEVDLPHDYLHMLNCVCIYKMSKNHKCYNQGDYVDFSAKRLTADAWSNILNDYYNRPLPEHPYYYIHNVSDKEDGYNPITADGEGTDMVGLYEVKPGGSTELAGIPDTVGTSNQSTVLTIDNTEVVLVNGKYYAKTDFENGNLKKDAKPFDEGSLIQTTTRTLSDTGGTNFNRVINIGGKDVSVVERETAYRYGNASKVRCEIRYGRDNSVYQLEKVFIDYIKAPQVIRLTKEQVDLTEDTSQIMEFPDYVCQEIINELTTLVMARDGDPRLQIQPQVT